MTISTNDKNERRYILKSKTKDLKTMKMLIFNNNKKNKNDETIKKTESMYYNNNDR